MTLVETFQLDPSHLNGPAEGWDMVKLRKPSLLPSVQVLAQRIVGEENSCSFKSLSLG